MARNEGGAEGLIIQKTCHPYSHFLKDFISNTFSCFICVHLKYENILLFENFFLPIAELAKALALSP